MTRTEKIIADLLPTVIIERKDDVQYYWVGTIPLGWAYRKNGMTVCLCGGNVVKKVFRTWAFIPPQTMMELFLDRAIHGGLIRE